MHKTKWERMRDEVEAMHLGFYNTLTGVGAGIGCDEIDGYLFDVRPDI